MCFNLPIGDLTEVLLDEVRLRNKGFTLHLLGKWPENLSRQRNWQYDLLDVLMFQAWLEIVFPVRLVMLKIKVYYRFLPEQRYAKDYLFWLMMLFNGQPAWFLNSPMAYSFKEDFGGGLAGNLWIHQLGVLVT